MRRRTICLAAILAAVMALQAPAVAFAEGTESGTKVSDDGNNADRGSEDESGKTITIDENVTITDDGCNPKPDPDSDEPSVVAGTGDVITVNGDVASTASQERSDGDNGTYLPAAVAAEGGTVQVNGTVTSQSTEAVYAGGDDGTVKVTGDVTSGVENGSTVSATGGSTVEIGGNVVNIGNGKGSQEDYGESHGTSNGITVTETSTVKVGGDVTVSSGTGVSVNQGNSEKGHVEVGGSVISNGDPTIGINGYTAIETNAASEILVEGDAAGVDAIRITPGGTGGTVAVLGAAKSMEDGCSVIVVTTEKEDKDAIVNELPQIIVGSLEGAEQSPEDYLYIGIKSYTENQEVEYREADQEVYDAVYQQILYYIAQDKFDNATLSVADADTYKNGYVSNEGKSLTVTIATADGYEVSSVSGTSVVKNADGTYTVNVQRGKGIDIDAVISAIVRAQQTASGSGGSESSVVIVVPAYAAAQKQFQTEIAAQLATLPVDGTLKLDMKDSISFNRKTFEILAQRNDVDVQITYTWNGTKYMVVIPAGYDILSLLNEDGYCGCLYLNSIFGSTELTK